MKKNRIVAIVLGICALAIVVAIIVLAAAPVAPPSQTVETTIPDAQIPR